MPVPLNDAREAAGDRRVTLEVEDHEFAAAADLPTGTLWAVGRSDNADLIVNSSNAAAVDAGRADEPIAAPLPELDAVFARVARESEGIQDLDDIGRVLAGAAW
jgi:hypothetical protein